MDVTHDDLVGALVVGLRLPHAEGDRVGLRVREELEAATLDDLADALVELESWRRVTLHRDGEIRRRVCKYNRILCYCSHEIYTTESITAVIIILKYFFPTLY